MQQGRDQEQVGAADAPGQFGGADGGLDEVPVDGPGVHGVALPAADRSQSGSSRVIRPSASSASHTSTVGRPAPSGVTSCSQGLGGPGGGQRAGGRGHPPHRVQGQRQTGLCGSGGGPQREHGSRSGLAARASTTSPSISTTPSASRGPLDRRRPAAAAEHGAQPGPHGTGLEDAAHLPPGHVAGVGDGARGLVDLAQQGVGVQQSRVRRRPGPVPGGRAGRWPGRWSDAARRARRAAGAGRRPGPRARRVRQPRGGDGPQRGHVGGRPAPRFRSGSSRYCSSPWRSARSSHSSRSSGRRLGAWLRQSARTAVRRPAVRSRGHRRRAGRRAGRAAT